MHYAQILTAKSQERRGEEENLKKAMLLHIVFVNHGAFLLQLLGNIRTRFSINWYTL